MILNGFMLHTQGIVGSEHCNDPMFLNDERHIFAEFVKESTLRSGQYLRLLHSGISSIVIGLTFFVFLS